MDLSAKEQIITLAALTRYMAYLEGRLASEDLEEGERADIANDATLLEILVARFEAEATGTSAPRS